MPRRLWNRAESGQRRTLTVCRVPNPPIGTIPLSIAAQIDIHGAEALPYNFFVSSSAIPGWTPRLADLEAALSAALVVANPDFQTRVGYPRGAPGKGNLSLGSKQVGQGKVLGEPPLI